MALLHSFGCSLILVFLGFLGIDNWLLLRFLSWSATLFVFGHNDLLRRCFLLFDGIFEIKKAEAGTLLGLRLTPLGLLRLNLVDFSFGHKCQRRLCLALHLLGGLAWLLRRLLGRVLGLFSDRLFHGGIGFTFDGSVSLA